MTKMVSIVTVSLNQGDFIANTIKSVLSQSGGFFIDYIIKDRGSTDQTISIMRQFEESLMQNCISLLPGERFK
ncbi:MAG: glycosyltransferase [Bacteroidetes bacterium]|nr:glycosyltransferase [Bacteroidota bacterium]